MLVSVSLTGVIHVLREPPPKSVRALMVYVVWGHLQLLQNVIPTMPVAVGVEHVMTQNEIKMFVALFLHLVKLLHTMVCVTVQGSRRMMRIIVSREPIWNGGWEGILQKQDLRLQTK